MPTLLHTVVLETKEYYQKASSYIGNYQLRHIMVQLIEERLYLIRTIDMALALNPEEINAIDTPNLYQPILRIINDAQKKSISSEEEPEIFSSIIKCEKETLKIVKTLLLKNQQQALRNLLSSLAASIQISLDKLEQLHI